MPNQFIVNHADIDYIDLKASKPNYKFSKITGLDYVLINHNHAVNLKLSHNLF